MAKLHKRKAIVFVSLVGVLSLTTTLLLVIAPAPLRPELAATLYNEGTTTNSQVDTGMNQIFQTDRPIETGQWKSILVRFSKNKSGSAYTIADKKNGSVDHFVICNGNGGIDGEIQLTSRWNAQLSALTPPGAASIDRHCLTICLIGNTDSPTPTQLTHLARLINSLQKQLLITDNQVWVMPPGKSQAQFTTDSLRTLIAK